MTSVADAEDYEVALQLEMERTGQTCGQVLIDRLFAGPSRTGEAEVMDHAMRIEEARGKGPGSIPDEPGGEARVQADGGEGDGEDQAGGAEVGSQAEEVASAPPVEKPQRVIGSIYAMTGFDMQPKAFTDQWPEIREWNLRHIVGSQNRDFPQFEWRLKYIECGQRFAYLQRTEVCTKVEGDWLLFLDTDMVFPVQVLGRMLMSMHEITARTGQCDVLTGLYCKREPNRKPLVYRYQQEIDHWPHILDFPWDRPFRVDGCGGGLLLIRKRAIELVIAKFGTTFELVPGYKTEDLCFNKRCFELGLVTWCDPRIRALHAYTGFADPLDFRPLQAEAIAEAETANLLYRPVPDATWMPLTEAAKLIGEDVEGLAVAVANSKLMAKHTPGRPSEVELASLMEWHKRGGT